jgi:MarR family transcriptional regulator, transcriptional regulator for hemolysin
VPTTKKVAASAATQSLGFLLADVLRLMRSEFRRNSTDLRLTPALARLLFYVVQQPGSSQAELAAFLDVTSVTVGRMIDRLEHCGFLQRRVDARDRRTFRIHLGKAAGPLVGQMNRIVAATTRRATRGLGKPECAALVRALRQMRSNLAQGGG